MMLHPLINYINDARKRGLSSKQITQTLTGAGWLIHDMMDIIVDHIQAPEEISSEDIITIRNASKSYWPKIKALDDVSLSVKRGSITALLGPNGAGKTTLVRLMATLLVPDSGSVTVAGSDVTRDAQQLRSIIGLAGQSVALDETLTGRENLEMIARLYHFSPQVSSARTDELLFQLELQDASDRPVKTYSGGMRRRLDLAASIIAKPAVLFLDEPTTGLDPHGRFMLWQIIRELVEQGTTVLLTTQYMEEADQLAHYIFVIDHGRVIAQGSPDELKQQVGGDADEEISLDDVFMKLTGHTALIHE
ncbi:MAG: hypothetical protein A3I39_01275 [Candidatus Yanofskybacteria bacterium RIFCSPLOWO2_02_FULL_47_9b]|uniref:ABC transporter domain-containing protein n=1 Tax=Candidatus Yanofskybacteria bacterium RIFCSPLOWO2_02_FULL_47_9b TaxID=1802708 RepID=A0A1F8HBG3_9BACT|nr:MAG: hypothetical protein A3I39_01275 [Candidatus Yanofskybacteria bacterium RIFCSPLOWO2_02_FULL_47_9b]